jgi:PA14 domain
VLSFTHDPDYDAAVTKRIVRGAVKMVAVGAGTFFLFDNRLRSSAAGIGLHMRKRRILVAWRRCDAYRAFWLLLVGILTFGPNGQSAQIPAQKIVYLADAWRTQDAVQQSSASKPFTVSVTAREVLVEVVATDRHGHPITDLKADDLEVFHVASHAQKVPERILELRVTDPVSRETTHAASSIPDWVTFGRTCAVQLAPYYVLSYRPGAEGWASGYHEILVTTKRNNIKLFYRHRYYVGQTIAPAKPPFKTEKQAQASLQKSACYHSALPSSINIAVRLLKNGIIDSLNYIVLVQPDSLAFTSLLDGPRHVELDYGVCTFDSAGNSQVYIHAVADRVLPTEEYAQSLAHGFGNTVELSRKGNPVFARFVVRDRHTGNVGSVGVVIPPIPDDLAKSGSVATGGRSTDGASWKTPVSSFGSPIPRLGTLCGDVYELSEVSKLPDFWNLEPVGALYAYDLVVPPQLIINTIGIPGVTDRNSWFGIDYYGEFWIREPGYYEFQLISDDGAKLYVDGEMVIDLDGVHPPRREGGRVQLNIGRHTIHVPYFQGPPHSVALMLFVKPPHAEAKPFDLRDFVSPADAGKTGF